MKAPVIVCVITGCVWGQVRSGVMDTTVANVANLPAQKIQANDLIAISVYGEPELTRTVRVSEDGTIGLPMLESPVKAAGLLPSQLEGAVADALREGQILVRPMVTVTLLEYNSTRTASVMGAVRKPLTFQVTGTVRLLDALAKAEGLTADAGPEVLVTSAGEEAPERIRVQDLLDGADPKVNL
jgi:polysaccharide biosynthesis/export protein